MQTLDLLFHEKNIHTMFLGLKIISRNVIKHLREKYAKFLSVKIAINL